MPETWDLWAEYCRLTGRETGWGRLIGAELSRQGVVPCRLALDVGCGTGEFTATLAEYTPRIDGIDVVDFRTTDRFPFTLTAFEAYRGATPDLVVFKQSYHLLADPDGAAERFPDATVAIAQMPRPEWDDAPRWDSRPLDARSNARWLEARGRTTSIVRLVQRHAIPLPFLERMFLDGYTADLRAAGPGRRAAAFATVRAAHAAGRPFIDALDLVVARPCGAG